MTRFTAGVCVCSCTGLGRHVQGCAAAVTDQTGRGRHVQGCAAAVTDQTGRGRDVQGCAAAVTDQTERSRNDRGRQVAREYNCRWFCSGQSVVATATMLSSNSSLLLAPRKDLAKVSRKRTRAPPTSGRSVKRNCLLSPSAAAVASILSSSPPNTAEFDEILASLTDNAVTAEPPPNSQVHYYYTTTTTQQPTTNGEQQGFSTPLSSLPQLPPPTHAPPQSTAPMLLTPRHHEWKPRLLLRQVYKAADSLDFVVGLESKGDYKSGIYLVSHAVSTSLTIEDLLGLRTLTDNRSVNDYLTRKTNAFPTIFLDTVAVEAVGNGTLGLQNYHTKSSTRYREESRSSNRTYEITNSVVRHSELPLIVSHAGWQSLKALFDCVENYYYTCAECSPTVHYLLYRYIRYFTKLYRTRAILSKCSSSSSDDDNTDHPTVPTTLDADLVKTISADLPSTLLFQINENRLPVDAGQDGWYKHTALRTAMLPWIDAEVRRYCTPNIFDAVVDNLTYVIKW